MATTVQLTAEQSAARAGITYEHFRRLRSAGHTPKPDGWLGKRAWWRPKTIDDWMRERTEQTA